MSAKFIFGFVIGYIFSGFIWGFIPIDTSIFCVEQACAPGTWGWVPGVDDACWCVFNAKDIVAGLGVGLAFKEFL